ncbi:hypothetical protein [Thalassobacillus devorans]|uniref:hypothetical protein n=1 Tax=Thalassobacillus devorans TaxID=279813 RepID=UPI00111C396E|nr:hypothetical protein [Thalassobacillus devorans]
MTYANKRGKLAEFEQLAEMAGAINERKLNADQAQSLAHMRKAINYVQQYIEYDNDIAGELAAHELKQATMVLGGARHG